MPILREKEIRRKERAPREVDPVNDLEPAERTHVLEALRVLRIRHGNNTVLCKALGIGESSLRNMLTRKRPSAGMAIRVARLAGVPVEDVLTGAFPKPGSCPMCGRCE